MTDSRLQTDGGSEQTDRSSDEQSESKKVQRAQKFHEQTGGFDDVAKALAILLVLGVIVYIIFVL